MEEYTKEEDKDREDNTKDRDDDDKSRSESDSTSTDDLPIQYLNRLSEYIREKYTRLKEWKQ